MTLRYLYQKHIVSRVSSYSSVGGLSVTRTELKMCENVHKAQTAQKSTPKHKTNRPTTEQKYRLGMISNIKLRWGGGGGLKPILQAPNLTLTFCSGSNIHEYKQLIRKIKPRNIKHRYQCITYVTESRVSRKPDKIIIAVKN